MNLRKDHYRVAYRLSSSPGSKRATVSSAQAEGPPHQFSPEIRAGARGAHAALLPRGAVGKEIHLLLWTTFLAGRASLPPPTFSPAPGITVRQGRPAWCPSLGDHTGGGREQSTRPVRRDRPNNRNLNLSALRRLGPRPPCARPRVPNSPPSSGGSIEGFNVSYPAVKAVSPTPMGGGLPPIGGMERPGVLSSSSRTLFVAMELWQK